MQYSEEEGSTPEKETDPEIPTLATWQEDATYENESSVTAENQLDPDEQDQEQSGDVLKSEIVFASKALGIGLLIGLLIGGIGLFRTQSSQAAFAKKLIRSDACPNSSSSPSGFCFNSPVTVSFASNNPLDQLTASQSTAVISASRSRIGIFANAVLDLQLGGMTGALPGSGAALDKTEASSVTGTLSLAYSDLTSTLQSSSNSGASIFYAGNNEIGTSNQVSYQGKTIPLVVISKIQLKNGQLYLTPETVNALGRTAPASAVFSSTAPVPIEIAAMPKGLSYSSLTTTKQYLVFHLAGRNISLGSLFASK